MKLNLIDTHAHVFMDHYDDDREKVIASAGDEKTGMINMGLDVPSSRKSVELAESHEGVYAGVGFHPHEAKDFGPSAFTRTNTRLLTISKTRLLITACKSRKCSTSARSGWSRKAN